MNERTNKQTKKIKNIPQSNCVREKEFLLRHVNAKMSTVTAAADVQQDVVEKLNGMRSVCTTSEHLIGTTQQQQCEKQ